MKVRHSPGVRPGRHWERRLPGDLYCNDDGVVRVGSVPVRSSRAGQLADLLHPGQRVFALPRVGNGAARQDADKHCAVLRVHPGQRHDSEASRQDQRDCMDADATQDRRAGQVQQDRQQVRDALPAATRRTGSVLQANLEDLNVTCAYTLHRVPQDAHRQRRGGPSPCLC